MGVLNTRLFSLESEIRREQFESIPIHILEREIILKFFNRLPIEQLKRLVNFKIIDVNNAELQILKDPNQFELIDRLRFYNIIKLSCEINIECSESEEEMSIIDF
jgi:hypothetical protein